MRGRIHIRTILYLLLLLPLGVCAQGKKSPNFLIHGKITASGSGESLSETSVYVVDLQHGVYTNAIGDYVLRVPAGQHTIRISHVDYHTYLFSIDVVKDTTLVHTLRPQISTLDEIIVTGEDDRVTAAQMGRNSLRLTTLKKMPALLGEPDVIRGLLAMPGVSTVGEGAAGYNVRGGSVDQNLVLLDDAPIFNTSHLFGFLTAFHSESVLSADLYKGGIPANFGGRVASVLALTLKQGNRERLSGSAGISLMAANLTLEGPIHSSRTTFLLSGRGSYSDWLLKTFPQRTIHGSRAQFYDGTLKLAHRINQRHQLSFTAYRSQDAFKFPGDTTYGWGTQNFTLKLQSTVNDKLFISTALVSSHYGYNVTGAEMTNEFTWRAGVDYKAVKIDANLSWSTKHKADVGGGVEKYTADLGTLTPGTNSNVNPFAISKENAFSEFMYYSHQVELTPTLSVRGGIRFSVYQRMGPGGVNVYQEKLPRSDDTFLSTTYYTSKQVIQTYQGWEPRLLVRYSITPTAAVKAAYDQTVQYLHLVSNTSAVSPVDLWKLSDPYLKPQQGREFSLGYYRRLKNAKMDVSGELFYKTTNRVLDYKDGGTLLLNDRVETVLLQGRGRAYGLECMVEKSLGRFSGWLSYTLSRTERKFQSPFPEETINQGNYYPANFDKLHNLAVTGSYRKTDRVTWNFYFTFASGRPITYPSSTFNNSGALVLNFEDRNNERTPPYHRLDLSMEIRPKTKPNQKWKAKWIVSIYNLYARKNPYSIFFRSQSLVIPQVYRLAVIGTAVPSVSYNITF